MENESNLCMLVLHLMFRASRIAFEFGANLVQTSQSYCLIIVYARADFFSVRVIMVWNKLSDDIVNAPSISSFSNKLKKFSLSFAFISNV